MADEAIIVELLGNKGDPIRYTIADGSAGSDIAKGSVMELTSPRTVIQSTNADRPIVGILAHEKVGGDGSTSVSVYTNGIFQMKCATTQCEIGDDVVPDATDNNVKLFSAGDREKGFCFGKAMETIAIGSTGMVRVLV